MILSERSHFLGWGGALICEEGQVNQENVWGGGRGILRLSKHVPSPGLCAKLCRSEVKETCPALEGPGPVQEDKLIASPCCWCWVIVPPTPSHLHLLLFLVLIVPLTPRAHTHIRAVHPITHLQLPSEGRRAGRPSSGCTNPQGNAEWGVFCSACKNLRTFCNEAFFELGLEKWIGVCQEGYGGAGPCKSRAWWMTGVGWAQGR